MCVNSDSFSFWKEDTEWGLSRSWVTPVVGEEGGRGNCGLSSSAELCLFISVSTGTRIEVFHI